ncbi:MAG: alpha/beta fold hydrolase [Myxococcaceae bacterium]
MTTTANVAGAKPGTFLLVHGAWHGGWCWRPLQKILEKAGATVFAPSLTGLGDRRHLLSEKVNLQTHVDDVVDLLESEELSDVTLVGHSYAGLVITGAAAKARERLAQVIYLDAFVPNPGQSMLDSDVGEVLGALARAGQERRRRVEGAADARRQVDGAHR